MLVKRVNTIATLILFWFASTSAFCQINDETINPVYKVGTDTIVTGAPKPMAAPSNEQPTVMRAKPDTIFEQKHSPQKATLLSLCLPGAGQVYNRKNWWWKVPIIYGGGAALTYGVVFYQQNYTDFKEAYIFREQNPNELTGNLKYDQYQTETLRLIRDSYKQARDQCIIGLALLYALQVIDANVEAHFFDFNVTDDLSLNVTPQIGMNAYTPYTGVALTFRFK
ncbi:MAG: DUF5683 domain-containing protein [Bacteroidia bacterium]|jgi:hypothetical protein|nr:DUF5683 domain-containing protein [Bacteroidia bacterium]